MVRASGTAISIKISLSRRSAPLTSGDDAVQHAHHIPSFMIIRQPLAIIDAENFHLFVVLEVGKEFGSDEEVLSTVGLASNIHHRIMNRAFRTLVHALIDFVNE